MKIPTEISRALTNRRNCAERLDYYCNIIDRFIIDNGLEDEIDTADFLGGAEIYANPKESEKAIRKAIKNYKEK